MRQTWKRDTKDKEKAIEAKQKQLEENWRFSELLKDKDDMVLQMRESLEMAVRDAEDKGIELKNVSSCMKDMKDKHDRVMNGQLKFNNANDNSLRRLHERQMEMEESLEGMNGQMSAYIAGSDTNRSQSANSNKSEDTILTVLDRTKHSLQKLLKKMDELLKIQRMFNDLNDEKYYILSYLGFEDNMDKQLKEAFQEYIVKNDDLVERLKKEIEKLKAQLFELKSKTAMTEDELEAFKVDNNNQPPEQEKTFMLDIVQKENEIKQLQINVKQLSAQNNTKIDRIDVLENEIQKLKSLITKLEKQLQKSRRPSTPRFRDFTPQDESKMQSPFVNNTKDLEGHETKIAPKFSKPMQLNPKRKDDMGVAYMKSKSNLGLPKPQLKGTHEPKLNVPRPGNQGHVTFPPINTKGQGESMSSTILRGISSKQGSQYVAPSGRGNHRYGTLLNISSMDKSGSPTSAKGGTTNYFSLNGFGK